jgi:hypothetical protein
VVHGLGEVIIVAAAMDARRHHSTRRRAMGVELVLRQTFADDVPVGHHADETIVLSNRKAPMPCSRINLANSKTGVSGLTQWTPLCIASLTFIEDLREVRTSTSTAETLGHGCSSVKILKTAL